jgi:hypothetical protein
MTEDQLRAYVSDLYPSRRWRARVKKMNQNQLFAIYAKTQKKLEEEKKEPEEDKQDEIPF